MFRQSFFSCVLSSLLIASLPSVSYASNHNFSVTSKEFRSGYKMDVKQVFNGFGCHGMNMSPSLTWEHEPEGTKSFAITLYDPDAPTNSGWWHWVVVNIPANVHSLTMDASGKGMMPKGALEVRNDFSFYHYGGACPPKGERHNYILTVWALKTSSLPLNKDSSAALASFMIMPAALAKAQILPYMYRTS